MKNIFYLLCFLAALPYLSFSASVIKGQLKTTNKHCLDKENMVWLSKEEGAKPSLLLSHLNLPSSGSFSFYVRPGKYRLVATNPLGCLEEQEVNIKNEDSIAISLNLRPITQGPEQ